MPNFSNPSLFPHCDWQKSPEIGKPGSCLQGNKESIRGEDCGSWLGDCRIRRQRRAVRIWTKCEPNMSKREPVARLGLKKWPQDSSHLNFGKSLIWAQLSSCWLQWGSWRMSSLQSVKSVATSTGFVLGTPSALIAITCLLAPWKGLLSLSITGAL